MPPAARNPYPWLWLSGKGGISGIKGDDGALTDGMLVAAARALADVVLPDEIGPNYIIPPVFHPDVAAGVAPAVRAVAVEEEEPAAGRK